MKVITASGTYGGVKLTLTRYTNASGLEPSAVTFVYTIEKIGKENSSVQHKGTYFAPHGFWDPLEEFVGDAIAALSGSNAHLGTLFRAYVHGDLKATVISK